MTDTFEHEVFSKYLNTTFRISLGESNTLEAELVSVGEHLLSPQQERFALVFRGPVQPLLPQAIYRFEHDEMGKFSLFIVPLRQDEAGTYYEACFNRVRKRDQ